MAIWKEKVCAPPYFKGRDWGVSKIKTVLSPGLSEDVLNKFESFEFLLEISIFNIINRVIKSFIHQNYSIYDKSEI